MARLVFAMPDPNARPRVGPTEKEWPMAKLSVSGWASPATEGEWTYFWLELPGASASYRCYQVGAEPTPWKALVPAADLFAYTGYEDEGDEEDAPGANLGAAERLAAGIYRLDFACKSEREDLLFEGIQFEILSAADQQRALDAIKVNEVEI